MAQPNPSLSKSIYLPSPCIENSLQSPTTWTEHEAFHCIYLSRTRHVLSAFTIKFVIGSAYHWTRDAVDKSDNENWSGCGYNLNHIRLEALLHLVG